MIAIKVKCSVFPSRPFFAVVVVIKLSRKKKLEFMIQRLVAFRPRIYVYTVLAGDISQQGGSARNTSCILVPYT